MDELYGRVCRATSRLVTRRYSTSFTIGVRCLGGGIRDAVFAIYGFVRLADEIVDTFLDFDREALLDEFEAEYDRAIRRGVSTNPLIEAFRGVVVRYGIDDALVRAFLGSMRMDLERSNYSKQEVATYIYGSAEAVGLMCLTVFVDGDKALFERLAPYAQRLGAAFQKVNFLRDLRHDATGLERNYFEELQGTVLTEAAKRRILKDIYDDFATAEQGIRQLPDCARLGVNTAYMYYLALARSIERTPAERLMQSRIRVPNWRKALLFGQAYFTRKSVGVW